MIATYYLGFVFVFASVHRFLFKKERTEELERLKLPKFFDIFIYSFEFVIGAVLLSGCPFFIKRIALGLLLAFLLVGCGLMVFYHYPSLIKTYKEIFTFQATSMSYCMHVAYIVLILTALTSK